MSLATIERLSGGDTGRLRAIRLRALSDAPDAFATTFDEAVAWLPENWARQLAELATFVATTDGDDIGLVRGVPHRDDPDAGFLLSMWVAPETRRQGIGSALVDAVVDWAQSRGFKRLALDVAESNATATAFYLRKGFVPNGLVGALPPPREHVREIQMVMQL